jgi:SAM-dependent methyltransferase
MPAVQQAAPCGPDGFDATRASAARLHDYLLSGKDHFAADRAVAAELGRAQVDPRRLALASRDFLRRAVGVLAQRGVEQFLDLGCGMPSWLNVHEMARAVRPGARVVYVDNDPVVVGHVTARLTTKDGVAAVCADIRDPAVVLGEAVRAGLDLSRPVAVLLVSVLDFIGDEADPAGLVAAFRQALAPDSYVTIATGISDGVPPDLLAAMTSVYEAARIRVALRAGDDLTKLFDGWDLLDPGVVSLPEWRPVPWTDRTPLKIPVLGGVARLRARAARFSAAS